MPQIKKSTPIYFKPSHKTAAALARLRERYPDKTRTAIIEDALLYYCEKEEIKSVQAISKAVWSKRT